jgi:CAAX protease family protein
VRTQLSVSKSGSEAPWAVGKVGTFLVLAFGISWTAYLLRRAGSWPPGVDEALRLSVKFGPSLAGLGVALAYGGVRDVGNLVRRLHPSPGHLRWLLLAFGLPLVILVVALPLRVGVGGSVRPLNLVPFADGAGIFGSLLATRFFLGGGLGEELGWRGVMLPELQQRVGAWRASLIIGVAHGLWHLPAYGPAVLFLMLFTISGSIIFTWMYNRTDGNLLLPAVMHATANASLPFLEHLVPAIDGEVLFPMVVFALWAAVAGLVVRRVGTAGVGPTIRDAGAF